ncbi:MAG: S26 family signal peptidase [Sciscionella sp.]|nr:S26 family signal peptidase [Sciscionella sp.]
MVPTLRDGDVVLALLGGTKLLALFAGRPREGSVVLVRWPSRPGQLSVKRAVRAVDDGWFVLGDNDFGSTDSRELGPADIVGVVLCRLWPHPCRLWPRPRRLRPQPGRFPRRPTTP